MATYIDIQKEIERLSNIDNRDEAQEKRMAFLKAKLTATNDTINTIAEATGIRRFTIEHKSLVWLDAKIESIEWRRRLEERDRREAAKASKARQIAE